MGVFIITELACVGERTWTKKYGSLCPCVVPFKYHQLLPVILITPTRIGATGLFARSHQAI